MRDLVEEQTKEWSEMVARQMTEEHDMKKAHLLQQTEILKGLIDTVQAAQVKELEARQDRYASFYNTIQVFIMLHYF